MRAAAALQNRLAFVTSVVTVLIATAVHAEPIGSGGSRAPLELTTRGMLLQRWDRNRDGKIDIGEAEMARTQMRRERIERAERSRVDPITGLRPAEFSGDEDEESGGLFRRRNPAQQKPGMPGSGVAGQGSPGSMRTSEDPEAAAEQSSAVPTVTLFGPPGLPSAEGSRGAGNTPLSSAARVLPETSGRSTPAGVDPATPVGGSRPFERPTAAMGGAITGGVRAGAPAVRPGYGTTGTSNDLNAGRLRGGSPADFRGAVRPGTPGGTTFRGFVPRGSSSLNAGRPVTPRPPTTPRPGSTPAEFYGP